MEEQTAWEVLTHRERRKKSEDLNAVCVQGQKQDTSLCVLIKGSFLQTG